MDAIALSQQRLALSRNVHIQRTIDRQITEDNKQEFSGIHAGHDCTTGEDIINNCGHTFRATPLSNGWVNSGDLVGGTVPLSGSRAISDRMPS